MYKISNVMHVIKLAGLIMQAEYKVAGVVMPWM